MANSVAQTINYDSFVNSLDSQYLLIQNDSALFPFYQKLRDLAEGKIDRVNILQIGDSHTQAGWTALELRSGFQNQFGNAGRGLIFPYQVAGSNSPNDTYSKSNVKWESYRNIHAQDAWEVGLGGFVITTNESGAFLKLAVNDKNNMGGYGFNRITLFGGFDNNLGDVQFYSAKNRDIIEENVKEESVYYTVKSGDNLGAIANKYGTTVSSLQQLNGIKGSTIHPNQKLLIKKTKTTDSQLSVSSFISIPSTSIVQNQHSWTYDFDQKQEFVFLHQTNTSTKKWDGFVLEEKDKPGVLFHSVGVNGARFQDYNKNALFFNQAQDLQADLVIVSLGTNETIDGDVEYFKQHVALFCENLKNTMPNACILLTTPTDNTRASSKVEAFATALIEAAEANNIAYFDCYHLYGGMGAFKTLQTQGLAQADKVHLTVNGYRYQGKLLYQMLFIHYEAY
jgi:LysM repeat protein/lysophospholipase L1-like esterase